MDGCETACLCYESHPLRLMRLGFFLVFPDGCVMDAPVAFECEEVSDMVSITSAYLIASV